MFSSSQALFTKYSCLIILRVLRLKLPKKWWSIKSTFRIHPEGNKHWALSVFEYARLFSYLNVGMSKMRIIVSTLILLISTSSYAQINYNQIDSAAKAVKYRGDIKRLVSDLTVGLNDDVEKTRAIYVWITENIKYDVREYNRGKRFIKYKCKTKEDCAQKRIEIENKVVAKALNRKKAICSGYALLFDKMCEIANVNASIINGYTKTEPRFTGKMGKLDHSWNSVQIKNETYYLDLTWAAGYSTKKKRNKKKLKKFFPDRNDFYWFTPIEKLSLDHFPEKTEQIANTNITKDVYKNQPYIETVTISKIDIVAPQSGALRPKLNDTLYFKFDYSGLIQNIQINTNLARNPKVFSIKKGKEVLNERNLAKKKYIDFSNSDSSYEFFYIVESSSVKYIEILFDFELKMKYLVAVEN